MLKQAIGWTAVAGLALGTWALAQADEPLPPARRPAGQVQAGQPLNTKDISLDQAHAAIAAAVEKARETDTKMDIAVVDAGGNLKAFVRMDGAWLGSIDISIKKARTARFFDMP